MIQWCFVVLLGEFATDIPRAWLLKINDFQNIKISNFSVPSSFEPGGREFESLRARHRFAVLTGRWYPFSSGDMGNSLAPNGFGAHSTRPVS